MDVEQVTSISWKENELNMVDTPGHADFGGEVYLSHDFFTIEYLLTLQKLQFTHFRTCAEMTPYRHRYFAIIYSFLLFKPSDRPS